MPVGKAEYNDGPIRLAEHTSHGTSLKQEHVNAEGDGEFFHGHLGECLVSYLKRPYGRDNSSCCFALSQLHDKVASRGHGGLHFFRTSIVFMGGGERRPPRM
jgi:hypothetical protein